MTKITEQVLRILPQKQNLVIRKASFPRYRVMRICAVFVNSREVIPECELQALTPGLGLLPVPLPVRISREEGMSELSGDGGDRWSLAEQEGSANQRSLGSSIRTWSRWV